MIGARGKYWSGCLSASPVPSRHTRERLQAGMQAQLWTLKHQMSLWVDKYTAEDMIQNSPLTWNVGILALRKEIESPLR